MEKRKSFSNLGKLVSSGKVTRGSTGQKEPYIRPEEDEETREKYKMLRTKKDPLFGYDDSKKMVDEANEAQAKLDAKKLELEEMRKKKNEPSVIDKFKDFFTKKVIKIDPKNVIKNIGKK